MSRGDNSDDFASRWSRRKRAVAEEEAAAKPRAIAADAPDATPQEELSEDELLLKLDLPVPETMQPGDDFSAFMRDGVPQFLRQRALRVLWRSNPVLANVDGLVDYGEDYTDAAMVPKVMKTLYQVGKGMIRETVEPETVPEAGAEAGGEALAGAARKAPATPAPASSVRPPETRPAPPADAVAADCPEAEAPEKSDQKTRENQPGAQASRETLAAHADSEDHDPPAPRPRRMRFDA